MTNENKQFTTLIEEIDKQEDPNPSARAVKRIRGPPIELQIPRTTKVAARVWRWMVNPEWLKKNPASEKGARIADNGTLWGDDEDPEDLEKKVTMVKNEKKSLKRSKPAGGGKKQKKAKTSKAASKPAGPEANGEDSSEAGGSD